MKTVVNLLVISQMAIKSHVFGNNWDGLGKRATGKKRRCNSSSGENGPGPSQNLPVRPSSASSYYFSATSSSVFFSNCQNGSTVSMSARSVVVCGDFIVGPRLTTSRCGYLPKITEHSKPA